MYHHPCMMHLWQWTRTPILKGDAASTCWNCIRTYITPLASSFQTKNHRHKVQTKLLNRQMFPTQKQFSTDTIVSYVQTTFLPVNLSHSACIRCNTCQGPNFPGRETSVRGSATKMMLLVHYVWHKVNNRSYQQQRNRAWYALHVTAFVGCRSQGESADTGQTQHVFGGERSKHLERQRTIKETRPWETDKEEVRYTNASTWWCKQADSIYGFSADACSWSIFGATIATASCAVTAGLQEKEIMFTWNSK